jgi:hypothetical protein
MATIQYNEVVTMETIACYCCGVRFAISADHRRSLVKSSEWFYCPNGHKQHYSEDNSETKRRQQAEQLLKERQEELWRQQARSLELEQELKKVTKKLKRVSKGVCPCCNRTFVDLQRHMATKHPETIK